MSGPQDLSINARVRNDLIKPLGITGVANLMLWKGRLLYGFNKRGYLIFEGVYNG